MPPTPRLPRRGEFNLFSTQGFNSAKTDSCLYTLYRDNFQLALDVFSESVQQKLGSKTLRRIVAAARHVLSCVYLAREDKPEGRF